MTTIELIHDEPIDTITLAASSCQNEKLKALESFSRFAWWWR